MAIRTVEWTLPTHGMDGTGSALDQSKLITVIYADGVEVGRSDPGATRWQGEVASVPGQTISFTARCIYEGQESALSEAVLFTLPFPIPAAPRITAVY